MYYEIVPMDRSHIDQIAALEREWFLHALERDHAL